MGLKNIYVSEPNMYVCSDNFLAVLINEYNSNLNGIPENLFL